MRCPNLFLLLAGLALTAAPIGAETIDFEELPAANDPVQTLAEEYAQLGVHFSTTDDGATWSGLSGASHIKKMGPAVWAETRSGLSHFFRTLSSISDISDEVSLEILRGEARERQEQARDRN